MLPPFPTLSSLRSRTHATLHRGAAHNI
jgi:hypothetical protein